MKPAGKILLTVLFISSLSDPVRASSPFPAGQNCVAWKARKTMFLMKNVEAVGVNCKVQIQLETTAPSHVQVKVAIPLAEFKSGEEERDLEVRKLLREEAQPELLFLSDTITAKDWPLVLSGNYNSLKGVLKIGGKNSQTSVPNRFYKRLERRSHLGS